MELWISELLIEGQVNNTWICYLSYSWFCYQLITYTQLGKGGPNLISGRWIIVCPYSVEWGEEISIVCVCERGGVYVWVCVCSS